MIGSGFSQSVLLFDSNSLLVGADTTSTWNGNVIEMRTSFWSARARTWIMQNNEEEEKTTAGEVRTSYVTAAGRAEAEVYQWQQKIQVKAGSDIHHLNQ